MTAQRSKAEADRLDAKAARMRTEIYLSVRDKPGFGTFWKEWPESWEKRYVGRLWAAHQVYESAVSAETKYNALRDAIEKAEREKQNQLNHGGTVNDQ